MASAELEKRILADINLNHKSLNEGVKHLIEWLTKQPHLPNSTDEDLLKGFIVGSKSVERAKEKLEKYYTLKSKHPVAFSLESRRPELIKWEAVEKMAILPNLTPEGYNVAMFEAPKTKEETDLYSLQETIKVFFMLYEAFLIRNPITAGQIVFIDSEGMSMDFLAKNFSTLMPVVFEFYQNALPTRLKAIVVYNSSSIADIFVNKILKAFLSTKLAERVFVHAEDHSVLSKYVPLNILPKDKGGNGPTFQQLTEETKKTLEKESEWLLTEGVRKSDESRRPLPDNDVETVRGTFRKLEVD